MARTNQNAVIAVLQADYDSANAPSLTPYIQTANVIVSRVNAYAVRKEITISSEELELIERWLAAHYYQQSDRGYSSRSTADASGAFQGQTGMRLESTMYGQTALTLDPSGCLADLGKRQPKAIWLGKTPSEQIDYVDRD